MTANPEILVVDDETQMRKLLRMTLEAHGYAVALAATGGEAIERAEARSFDAIILDLGLPDADGIDVLKRLRAWVRYPILILSVRSAEADIVAALETGANDYLTKPFRGGELVARLRSAIRIFESRDTAPERLAARGLEVDFDARTVKKRGQSVKLTPTEFSLLGLFVRNAGKVLTHSYILQQIWGPKFDGETQYTRVYIAQLRKKLEDDPNAPTLFVTESGIGYRFADEE